MSVPDRISAFMEGRDHRQDTQTWNLLNTSLGGWLRYWGFLSAIRDRYAESSDAYVRAMQELQEQFQKQAIEADSATSQQITPDMQAVMDNVNTLGTRVHLEIESFYVFAKILLDRTASTFGLYFCRDPKWRHARLTKDFQTITAREKLVGQSDRILKEANQLRDRIGTYRNKRIVHVEEPRMIFGTSWGPDRKTKITPAVLYPTEAELEKIGEIQKSTGDLDEILHLLDTYIVAMLDFFDANAEKSVLPVKTT